MAENEKHIDVPEADAQEQARPYVPAEHLDDNPRVEIDVAEADAQEQAKPINLDEVSESETR